MAEGGDTQKLMENDPSNYSTLAPDEGAGEGQGQPSSSKGGTAASRFFSTLAHHLPYYNPLSYFLPRRYGVATLAFFGFCNVYSLRVNLSVAIVAMTAPRFEGDKPEFDWDSKKQGLILSTFFYGYLITQVPGGWMARNLGGKRVFGFGILTSSLLSLLTPVAVAVGNSYALMAIRVLQGLAEGVCFPAIHEIWSKWAPVHERSRLATIAFSGSYVGTVIALPVSGILTDIYGWQLIFYVFGVIGALWATFWILTVGESPHEDKRISEDEIDYIERNLGSHQQTKKGLPWGKLLKSTPVWAINIAHFAENWGFYTLLTFLPRFMNDMFGQSMSQTGFLAALPYMLMAITVQVAGFLADYARAHYFSTTTVRKLFTCTAFISQTTFMICAAYVGRPEWALACLSISIGLGGLAWAGFSVNHLDLAPQYASVLMGISNTFATIPGIFSPYLTGKMLKSGTDSTIEEWRGVFSVSASIYLVGALVYGLLASGEQQKWAGPSVEEIMQGTDED